MSAERGVGAPGGAEKDAVAIVVDDYALGAFPGLDQELARAGALVMRAFRGLPNPQLLRRYRGAAVIGGPDRTGLLSRLERASASVAAPVIAILPPGVAAEGLRGPGVVDVVPAGTPNVGRRILLMARVPVVTAVRGAAPEARPAAAAPVPAPVPARAAAHPLAGGPAGEVIAVASSTGGVWVLASLLRDLPPAGRAVLVAQHLEAEFVPFFAEWLQGASGWPTVVVDEATPIAAGATYVPAGGRDLVVDGPLLRALPAASRFVPCADRLLASAAALGARATGVVLSGMGADGAAGLAAIAARGGRAFCQAPSTAVVSSMPEAALRRTPAAITVLPPALAGAIAARQLEALELPDTSAPTARR